MKCSEPEYGVILFQNLMVPMRDGERLATDIYRPGLDGELLPGPFPTILMRTSYDKTADRYVSAVPDFFTPRGYAVVMQDLRGRYRSEGKGQYHHVVNPDEGRDGFDTVEWIAAQPWSNGRVGTVGSSHPGLIQTHMALYQPPHLTAIWPDVSPINSYAHQVRMGGAMQLGMFGALFLHAQDSQEAQADPVVHQQIVEGMERMRELVFATPFKRGETPLAAVPNLEETLLNYYTHGDYDDFWKQECNDFSRYFDRHADIPGTYSGGWFDGFPSATTGYFAAMAKQNGSTQRLIMGPWTHMGLRGGGSSAGDVEFGTASDWGMERYNVARLRWFDRWLKEIPNEVESEPPVHIFVMGGGDGCRTREGKLNHGGQWRTEHEWPLARTEYTEFYLRSDGRLTSNVSVGDDPPVRFTFDPGNPVPTISGSILALEEMVPLGEGLDPYWTASLPGWVRMRSIVREGPSHQVEGPGIVGAKPPYLPLADRPDVLVFQTSPLNGDVEVTGPIIVNLWISSSAVDTDFTARLIDVYPSSADYPSGYHMNLTDSIIRVRYRDSWEEPELMEPGVVYQVRIDLPPTSNLFQAGHRIRLDVSSSDFPRFDINPNTGEPMGRHTHSVLAHNSVWLGREHPSHIVLPIIP